MTTRHLFDPPWWSRGNRRHGLPRAWARLLDPAARLACLLGGSDINARPWTLLERTARDVQAWSLRGGHVQVRVGTL